MHSIRASAPVPLPTADPDIPAGVETGPAGLRWYWQVGAFCAAIAIVILRQPEAILHAQFVAEDGHVWFADAYNRGWFVSLFTAYNGYLVTLPRLAAALALLVPLGFAPLLTNVIGLFVQVLPVPILLSARLSCLGSLGFRFALALTYLAMPNCREVSATVTESQWHLALVAFLLLLAAVPQNRRWRHFDSAMFLLCGLTGPLCIFLLPIVYVTLRRDRRRWLGAVILACTSIVQTCSLVIAHSAARFHTARLGASPEWLVRIVAGQVYLGSLVGHNTLALDPTVSTSTLILVAAIGTTFSVYWLAKAELEFRLFALFTVLVFCASLQSPAIRALPPGFTAWKVMAGAPAVRYWFFPTLACCWMPVWFIAGRGKTQITQITGTALLFFMSYGFIRDWRHPAYPDLKFAQYAARVAASKQGEMVVIPQNPIGRGWEVRLIKR